MPMTHAQRQKVLEEIERKSIVDVAESLGITLVRQGQSYTWSEHDSFVLTPKRMLFIGILAKLVVGVLSLFK